MKCTHLAVICTFAVFYAASPIHAADDMGNASPKAVQLSVSGQTPVTEALASLAKSTGRTILADSSVTESLNSVELTKANVPEMLDAIDALAPGLSWQTVYLPQNAPAPSADTLSRQVHALKAITESGLVVSTPADHSWASFSKEEYSAEKPPAGMRVVYLVTDETAYAQNADHLKAAMKKAADNKAGQAPAEQAQKGIQDIAQALSKMSPDQQRQFMPQLMQAMQQLMQSLDPSVRNQMWPGQRSGGYPASGYGPGGYPGNGNNPGGYGQGNAPYNSGGYGPNNPGNRGYNQGNGGYIINGQPTNPNSYPPR